MALAGEFQKFVESSTLEKQELLSSLSKSNEELSKLCTLFYTVDRLAGEVIYLLSKKEQGKLVRNSDNNSDFSQNILEKTSVLEEKLNSSKHLEDIFNIISNVITETLQNLIKVVENENNSHLFHSFNKKLQKFIQQRDSFKELIEQHKLDFSFENFPLINQLNKYIKENNINKKEIFNLQRLCEPCYICFNRGYKSLQDEGLTHYESIENQNFFNHYFKNNNEIILKGDKKFKYFHLKTTNCCVTCYKLYHEKFYNLLCKYYRIITINNDESKLNQIYHFISNLSLNRLLDSNVHLSFLFIIKNISYYRYHLYKFQLVDKVIDQREEGIWNPIIKVSKRDFFQQKSKPLTITRMIKSALQTFKHNPCFGFLSSMVIGIDDNLLFLSPICKIFKILSQSNNNNIENNVECDNIKLYSSLNTNRSRRYYFEDHFWFSYSLIDKMTVDYQKWIYENILKDNLKIFNNKTYSDNHVGISNISNNFIMIVSDNSAESLITEISFGQLGFGVLTFPSDLNIENNLSLLLDSISKYQIRILILQNRNLLNELREYLPNDSFMSIILLSDYIDNLNNNETLLKNDIQIYSLYDILTANIQSLIEFDQNINLTVEIVDSLKEFDINNINKIEENDNNEINKENNNNNNSEIQANDLELEYFEFCYRIYSTNYRPQGEIYTNIDMLNIATTRTYNSILKYFVTDRNPSIYIRSKFFTLFYSAGMISFPPLHSTPIPSQLDHSRDGNSDFFDNFDLTNAVQRFNKRFVRKTEMKANYVKAKACASRSQERSSHFQWNLLNYYPEESDSSKVIEYIITNFSHPCLLGTNIVIGSPFIPSGDYTYFHSNHALKGWVFQNHMDCAASAIAGAINTAFEISRDHSNALGTRDIVCVMKRMEEKVIGKSLSNFYKDHPVDQFPEENLHRAIRQFIAEASHTEKFSFPPITELMRNFLNKIDDPIFRYAFRQFSCNSVNFAKALRQYVVLHKLDAESSSQDIVGVVHACKLPIKCWNLEWYDYTWDNIKRLVVTPNTALMIALPYHLTLVFGGGEDNSGKKHLLVGRPSGGQAPCGWMPWDHSDIVDLNHLWPTYLNHNPGKDFKSSLNRCQVAQGNPIFVVQRVPSSDADEEKEDPDFFHFLLKEDLCNTCYYKPLTRSEIPI